MGAHVKVAIHRSPWDRYTGCHLCGAVAGSPCIDLRRITTGPNPYLRVQPHPARRFEDTYQGPITWPNVGMGEI